MWRDTLKKNQGNVEMLYLHDDVMLQDSKEQYESWKIIQEEIGGFEKQLCYFRLVSEIVADLSSRNVVELSIDGKTIVCNNNEWEKILRDENESENHNVVQLSQDFNLYTKPFDSNNSNDEFEARNISFDKGICISNDMLFNHDKRNMIDYSKNNQEVVQFKQNLYNDSEDNDNLPDLF